MADTSRSLWARAKEVIPGGVNSPVRAFNGVDSPHPLFISKAAGPFVYDVDGCRYIDYVGSWGPMILGHSAPLLQEAIRSALIDGTSFGAPTSREVEFAELLQSCVPSLEKIRMVNSGTEATMSAVRLARGVTSRDVIIKCNGCYHGHADTLLVSAGSGVATCGISGSPGVPDAVASLCLSVEFNDVVLMEQTISAVGGENVAAIIVEPVPGNMGLVIPSEGYLQALRKICDKHNIVLIFDEVMSGFRVGLGGASERFGVKPDLITLGKVIGGGLPVGAFGGRKDLMDNLAPIGPVYQAGTLSGNPLAMAAGIAQVSFLKDENPYPTLEEKAKTLIAGIKKGAEAYGISLEVNSCGSMFGMFFSEKPVTNFSEAKATNIKQFKEFFSHMLSEGVYLAPSAFEAGFISNTHSEEIISQTIDAASKAFQAIAS